MAHDPGSIPGPRRFPSTCWSRILGAGGEPEREALDALSRLYWPPVCAYLQARWGLNAEAARDETQEFFVKLLEKNLLAKADPERGRFRSLVMTALDNAQMDRFRASKAAKRGGGAVHLSVDAHPLEPCDPRSSTPEQVLDREWRRTLVARALEQVRADLGAQDKELYFMVFEDYFVHSDGDLDYSTLARRYGITHDDVSNYLRKAKQVYRLRLEEMVRETVRTAEDLELEMAWLFGEGSR